MSDVPNLADEEKSINWKLTILVVLFTFSVSIVIGYFYHQKELTKINNLKTEATSKVSALNTELVALNDLLKFKTNDFEKLKTKMSGIKDKNDLLKRDIKLYIVATHKKVPRVVAKTIAENVVELSRKHKVSPELIMGIIKVESYFDPMAVGPKTKYGHARGLMQVIPEWVKKLGLKSEYDFHNIDVGIESGIKVFLIHLEEAKGDISTGLYYYVNKDKSYVGKVYSAMGKFVAFRSTIDEETQNVGSEVENNNDDSKKLPEDDKKKGEEKKTNDPE